MKYIIDAKSNGSGAFWMLVLADGEMENNASLSFKVGEEEWRFKRNDDRLTEVHLKKRKVVYGGPGCAPREWRGGNVDTLNRVFAALKGVLAERRAKRDTSPKRKKKGCRCETTANTAKCDQCGKYVCRWCRYDSYDHGQWVLSACRSCLFIVADGIPTGYTAPNHCGDGYFEAYQAQALKEAEEESAKAQALQLDEPY
jgi:hypothetical protein